MDHYFKRPFFNSVEEMNEWIAKQQHAAHNQTVEMVKAQPSEAPGCVCPKVQPGEVIFWGGPCPVHSPR